MSTGPLESAAPTTPYIVGGVYNTVAPTPVTGQGSALQVDASGNVMVNIAAGSSSGTQYADGTTQATPTGTVALGKNPSNVLHALALSAAGNLNVNLAEGTISGGNAAASATGAAVPASADYIGVNIAGNLVGVTGFSLTNSKAAAMAIVDGSGNQITSFGGGTQFSDNAASGATPTGTLSMGWDSVNSKIRALKVDASQNLLVDVANTVAVTLTSTTITGTVAVTQSTNPWTVAGTAAVGAAASGNPEQMGGIFNTNPSTITSGQMGALQLTNKQYLLVTLTDNAGHQANVDPNGNLNFDLQQVGGSAVTLGQKTMANSIPVVLASDESTLNVSVQNATLAVTQSTSPWVDNLTQVAGVALGATAVTNYGTAPAAAAVPGVNAFVTNTVAVSGTVTSNQGGAPWTVKPDGTVWTLTGTSANVNVTNTVPVTLTSTTITGTVAVTQSTSPWVENVSQFGGSNVVTGTGTSGAGIPRVTVSSDSFPATTAVVGPDTANKLSATQPVQIAGVDTSGFVRTLAVDDAGNLAGNHQDLQLINRSLQNILQAINNLNTVLNAMPVPIS